MKRIIVMSIILLIIAVVAYNYVYKEHRNIASENPEFTIESEVLLSEFVTNSESTSQKYLNKTLGIIGTVTGVDEEIILLDNSIVCYMLDSKNNSPVLNSKVVIKGRFIGYDDLLEEIKIDQVSIVK